MTWKLAEFTMKHPEKILFIIPNDTLLLHYMTKGYLYTHLRGVLDIESRTYTKSANITDTLGYALLGACSEKKDSLQETLNWLPMALEAEIHKIPWLVANRLLDTISLRNEQKIDPENFRASWNTFFLELSKRDPSWRDFFRNKLPIGFGESKDVIKTLRDREYSLTGKYILLRARVVVLERNTGLTSLNLSDENESLSLIPHSLTTRETLLRV